MATEVGVAYVSIVPKADGFSSGVASASKEAGEQGAKGIKESLMSTLKGSFGDLFSTGGEMGSKLAGGMESFLSGAGKLAVVGAVAAIGVEALKQLEEIGAQIDAMTDSIIVGTGASGEQLESLKQTAMEVATEVPVGFATSGDIIQDFATRLNLSGDELATVAERAAQLNKVTGGFNYDNMATMFNVWSVGADEMNEKMDYMWGVSQNTGIGFDSLTSVMKTSAPALKNLGFSFEQSANMAGLLDKAGIDASGTMSKMSKALVELSEPGESAQEAFQRVISEMQGYIEAGDTASAMEIAQKVFGTRGAAQFIGALQSGALNMDALSDAALGASGSIEGTYNATKSWPEQWELIQTRVQAALEPLGSAVFSTLGDLLEGIGGAMTAVWQASEPLRNKMSELAAGIGERLAPIIERLSPLLGALADGALAALGWAFETVANAIGVVADAVSWVWDNALAPFGSWLSKTFGPMLDGAKKAFDNLAKVPDAIGSAFKAAADVVTRAWQPIADFFDTIVRGLQTAFKPIADYLGIPFEIAEDTATDALNGISSEGKKSASNSKSAWNGYDSTVGGKFKNANSTATQSLTGIVNKSVTSATSSGKAFNGFPSTIRDRFSEALANASSKLWAIPPEASGAQSSARDKFSGLGARISSAIGGIHFPQPHVTHLTDIAMRLAGGVMQFIGALPNVSWWKTGGMFDGASLIGVGEAGPEMVLPQSGGLMDTFSENVTEHVSNEDLINWLEGNLGPIIEGYAPTSTPRETRRMIRKVAAYA